MIVLYDANVLYSGLMRDLLMRLALANIFQAKWTNDIQEEWIRNLSAKRPDLPVENHQRVRLKMEEALPDALVTGHEYLIPTLTLPDPNDRHVLAAAIHCGANKLVTSNLKDFPSKVLKVYGIEAQHPDDFACGWLEREPDAVILAVSKQRKALLNPPKTVQQLLIDLEERNLKRFAKALESFRESL
jgi:predicted nucleic acid-binding protein